MKFVSLHTDYLKVKPLKKALKSIADLSEIEKKGFEVLGDPLVILTSVEAGDSEKIVGDFVKGIEDIAKQVNAKNIVLYPYAHLSSNLGSPDMAVKILDGAEKELKKLKKFEVFRAPFGYYKEFEMKVKGHPLSELSREIKGDGKVVEKEEEFDYKTALRSLGKNVLDKSKLKDNDHRILGQHMNLFSFSDVAPGMA